MREYDELIAELRQHHCDAKEDDTQEVCEECAYDVIIADESVPRGIASVCVCGLMNRAADAIEELVAKLDSLQFFEENITKLPNCNTCLKKNMCEFVPRAGEYCRINCPAWLGQSKEAKDA